MAAAAAVKLIAAAAARTQSVSVRMCLAAAKRVKYELHCWLLLPLCVVTRDHTHPSRSGAKDCEHAGMKAAADADADAAAAAAASNLITALHCSAPSVLHCQVAAASEGEPQC
jgi:hypothetical protein